MRNKTIALLLATALVLALAACGQPAEEPRSAEESPQALSAQSQPPESPVEVAQGGEPAAPDSSMEKIPPQREPAQGEPVAGEDGMIAVGITVGGEEFSARFYDSESARVLLDQMPLTLEMDDYAAQEKVLRLPYDFPSAATELPPTIQAGQLYLWSGNSLVLFYTTFSNSYGGYVPIGYIEDVTGLAAALGSGGVSVTFRISNE